MESDTRRFYAGDVVGSLSIVHTSAVDDDTGHQDVWAICSCTMYDMFHTTRKKILKGDDACRLCLRARLVSESCHVNMKSDSIRALASVQEHIYYTPGVKGRKLSEKYGKLVARRLRHTAAKYPCEVCVYWNDDCSHVDCFVKGNPVVWRPAQEADCKGIKLSVDGVIQL